MKKVIILSMTLLCALSLSAQDIEKFVKWQMETYPELRLLDIYKSCFQDYMGAEHLVSRRRWILYFQSVVHEKMVYFLFCC